MSGFQLFYQLLLVTFDAPADAQAGSRAVALDGSITLGYS